MAGPHPGHFIADTDETVNIQQSKQPDVLILRSLVKTAEVPGEKLLRHWENMQTSAVVSACYCVIGIALQYHICPGEDVHTHAAPVQMEQQQYIM